MKTIEVEVAVMKYFDITRNIIVPNVTDNSFLTRFETDLLVLSKSNYATGVEIKVSKADLKRDLKKSQWNDLNGITSFGKRKIKWYFEPYKYFYYAVPEKLKEAALNQIPEWCGLIVVRKLEVKNLRDDFTYNAPEVVRYPQTLFKKKWSQEERLKLAELGAMRIMALKNNLCGG